MLKCYTVQEGRAVVSEQGMQESAYLLENYKSADWSCTRHRHQTPQMESFVISFD